MSRKPTVGDVFLIPLDQNSAVGGLLLAVRDSAELYIAVFNRRILRNEADLKTAICGDPVLLTLTFDAKLFHGDWPVIGSLVESVSHYPEVNFKVKHAGVMSIESRDKLKRRPATSAELQVLEYRSVASPAIIEDAIRAHFGIGEWSESYEKRRAEYAIASSKLI